MNRLAILGFILIVMPMSCRTAKVQYTPTTSIRDADLQIVGNNQCRLSGDRIIIDFPNHNNCTGRIWDYQRKVCATHIPEVSCASFADVTTAVNRITTNTAVLNTAKDKKAKILACSQRETSTFNDYTVQVVYPPAGTTTFTQDDCQKGTSFKVETICFRLCKTQNCTNGVLTGSDADKLVFDCLEP